MPKKPKTPHPDAMVVGYSRKSHIEYPDDCTSAEGRAAFLFEVRRSRIGELEAKAKSLGLLIDRYYDDMDITGTEKGLSRRDQFLEMRADALAGRIKTIIVRDTSRLFRDPFGKDGWEPFYQEMQSHGVTIYADDLPEGSSASDNAMRRIMAVFHAYRAENDGENIRRIQTQKVREGTWVGRTKSMWGLTYNKERKGYDYEPLGALKVCALFALFIEKGGNGCAVATDLNSRLAAGDPSAFPTRSGHLWRSNAVLGLITNPIWLRRARWMGIEDPLPDLIPEVVPEATVLRAMALARGRKSAWTSAAASSHARQRRYLYSGLVACELCGSPARARRTKRADHPRIETEIAYACKAHLYNRSLCPDARQVPANRLHALVSRALALATEMLKPPHNAQANGKEAKKVGPKIAPAGIEASAALSARMLSLRREAAAYRTMRAKEECDEEEYQSHLSIVRAQMAALTKEAAQAAPPVAAPLLLTDAEWQEFADAVQRFWGDGSNFLSDADASAFLTALGVRLRIQMCGRQAKPTHGRLLHARALLHLEIPALGLIGERAIVVSE